MSLPDFAQQREEMVRQQLVGRGIRDTAVLRAMHTVPRHLFVPQPIRGAAYKDRALPLFAKQTISQPYVVARMIEHLQLQPSDRVLEIGAGSGYAAAVMSRVAAHVYTIERLPELAQYAATHLQKVGYDNVTVIQGDGTLGLPEEAPFDAITVAANGPKVPPSLKEQLAINGRLIIPVGNRKKQRLLLIRRTAPDTFTETPLTPVRFVPLIGEEGWEEKD